MNRNEIPRIENSNFDNQQASGEKGSFKRKSPTRFIIFVFLAGILAGIIATLIISLSSRNSARKMPITFSNNNFTLTPKGAIFHQSEPVNPNETVLATGGSWTENSSLLVILTLVDDLMPKTENFGFSFFVVVLLFRTKLLNHNEQTQHLTFL